jgi:HD-GYP domain-containing protein (c-di-GMP phosphodiesterase class II)
MSCAVAISLGMEERDVQRIGQAALLHDIGKVAVDDQILAKPSGLTDEEFAQIRVHPEIGSTMLNHAGLREEARWVRHHHERLDGTGYPDGIAGNAIPLESRVLFVADAFEAMTSDRPYRRGVPVADAMAELRICAGSQFDPVVVDALEALVTGGRLAVLALRDAA